jgi:hypothetical protein
MAVSYDVFINTFLSKITEYEFIKLDDKSAEEILDGFLKRAVSEFKAVCKYDLVNTRNDVLREFDIEISDSDLDEIADIISEGMVVQWLKGYVNKQENLENVMNTRDFITYSPAELLMRVGNAYTQAKKDYTQMIREYSYVHGDLTTLHI